MVGADVTIDQLAANQHPVLARLREHGPVVWLSAIDGWLVTGRQAAIGVMRDPDRFTVDDPRFSTAQVIGPSMLSLDGAEHDRHRAPFADPFRSAEVRRRFGTSTARRARQLVTDLAPEGEAELRSRLAAPLAVDVITDALGLRHPDRHQVLSWYDAIVAAVDSVTAGGGVGEDARVAFADLSAAVDIAAIERDDTLTRRELASNAAVLLFGGIVTAEGTTASTLYHLLAHPDQLDLVRSDRSLVANAVEESLRLEPAAAVVDRYATTDVELDGASIRSGDLVRVSLAGANRDPAFFTNPDRYDVRRRDANQHLSFARGPHACLGIHLARLETSAAVNAVLDLLPAIAMDRNRSTPPEGLIFRKPKSVQATWT